jgi:hypothetical protein
MGKDSDPEIRINETPPTPGGLEMAQILSDLYESLFITQIYVAFYRIYYINH